MYRNNILHEDLDHILEQLGKNIEQFRNKKIFITGGTGFFGTWILETFVWANEKLSLNAEVLVLTRNIEKFQKKAPHIINHENISFLIGDVKTFKFPEDRFDYIIHSATDSTLEHNASNALMLFDTIIEGTRHLLDFAVKSGSKNILHISSGGIYGKQTNEISHLNEDFMGSPDLTLTTSAYSEAKRSAEMLCVLYADMYGLSIKVARCFAFVGPYLPINKHFAIGNFISNLIDQQPIVINGDGSPLRSYLYSSDLIIWLFTILIAGKNCYPYNVGSEEVISIEQLANLIGSLATPPLHVEIKSKKKENQKIEKYVPCTQRACKELFLKQTVSLKEGILKTKEFYSRTY